MKTNKIFAMVVGAIIGGFLVKSYHKLHQKPLTREEAYRLMKAEHERRQRREFVQGLGKVKEEPRRLDQMDAMALRPKRDMATESNFEPAIGSCAR